MITKPATQQEFRIEPFRPQDAAILVIFVQAIQDYERTNVPELKPGSEIGPGYADLLMRTVAERSGLILLAKAGEQTIGFACAWIDEDDDPLLRDDARQHAYISDIFVSDDWRRKGVARALLKAIEEKMREHGCRRIRVCSKATNVAALTCYEAAGYRPYEVIFSKAIDDG